MRGASRAAWFIGCVASLVVFEIGAWMTTAASRHVWADVCWLAVDIFATFHCWQTARRARPAVRLAWWCFTIALACWTAGMTVWAYFELVRGRLTPFPSLVDVFGWIGAPFLIAGVFFYKTRDRSRVLGLKQSADLALTVAAIVALMVAVLYVPASDARYPTTYVASALATPMLGITAVVFGLITLWQHIGGPRRRVLGFVIAGVFLLAAVSTLYGEALLAGRYRAGDWIDVLWVIGFLAFATAAREERRLPDEEVQPLERPARLDPVVPTAALVVWMVAWLGSGGAGSLLAINAISGAVLALALFVRMWATQRIERALAARIAQEQARTWQLEARLERAQRLEAIGTLAGGVAHDFNNVLGAATGGLKIARRKLARGESVVRDLDDVEAVLWRAADLTSRLLDLARKREPNPVVVDPGEAIERVRVLLDKVVPSGVRIAIEYADDVPAILVDPSGLEHALLNLGINARDELRDRGGTMTLRARTAFTPGLGESVVLEVSDDGDGIPPDVLTHVFEPFFTTKADEGTGLGLAMVEAFATANGGVVAATSTAGQTTFRLAFPAADTVAAAAAAQPTTATVLVVSREDATGLATAGALARGGIAAFVARDATMALAEYARLPRVDAIVVDAATGLAGRDAMRALRQAGMSASSILLMAPGGDDDAGDWTAIVRKPYEPRALVEEVQRAIATRVAGAEPAR
jgi:signal transduction histidine kinase